MEGRWEKKSARERKCVCECESERESVRERDSEAGLSGSSASKIFLWQQPRQTKNVSELFRLKKRSRFFLFFSSLYS